MGGNKKRQGRGTSSLDDDDVPPPSPPPPYIRPQKLRRYSGEEDAADFIREATLMLTLQPMPDLPAASWILGSLEGQARDQVLSLEAREVDSPAKIFSILNRHWGERRDASTLAGAFYKRQQGRHESVAEYAAALRRLWGRTNDMEPHTLSHLALRDAFASGLTPSSMRRDVKRFLREQPDLKFDDAVEEASRWMREDDDTSPSHHAPIQGQSLDRLETQMASLMAETTALRNKMDQQSAVIAAQTSHRPGPHSGPDPTFPPRGNQGPLHPPGQLEAGERKGLCWNCQRPGHFARECQEKQGPQHQNPRRDRRERCGWCQRPGHSQKDCRARDSFLRQSGQNTLRPENC